MNRAERRRMEKQGRRASPQDLLHDAARFHRAGQLAEAESRYRALLERSPAHSQALHLLGLVCHQTGRNREAAALIADAEARTPDDPEIPYNLGNCLLQDARPAEAADAFRRALAIRPGRADALNNLGTALQRLERFAEAIDAHQGALDAEPGRLDALCNLAHALQAVGRREEAIFAYRQVLAKEPNHATARHMVAAMTSETPMAAPTDYVRQLFDEYADRFDAHLTAELAYAPQRFVDVLRRAAGPERRFANAVDLGCGTGLAGTFLRPLVDRLVGVDLSPAMLTQAEAKGIFDALSLAALEPYLETTADRFDLFFAADVFVYLGAVDGLFAKAAARATPGAWIAFSVETAEGEDFVLRPSGRYAHSISYLERVMGAAGWQVRDRETLAVRTEHGIAIPGLAVAAQLR